MLKINDVTSIRDYFKYYSNLNKIEKFIMENIKIKEKRKENSKLQINNIRYYDLYKEYFTEEKFSEIVNKFNIKRNTTNIYLIYTSPKCNLNNSIPIYVNDFNKYESYDLRIYIKEIYDNEPLFYIVKR